MTIKNTSPYYCKQAINVYKKAFESKMKLSMKLIKNYIKNNIYRVTILTDDKETLVGFTFLIPMDKYSVRNVVHIDYLAIDPSQQGKGYATKILNKVIHENASCSLTLECENHLVGLYEKFNFIKQCSYEFKGKQMNFMTRGQLKRGIRNRILSLLHVLQNPELYVSNIIPDTFIGKLTHTIGVIKVHRIWYSKHDSWLRRHFFT